MSVRFDTYLLHKGRAVCPNCGAKGVGYPPHPHAYGRKDFGRAQCRYCRVIYRRWAEDGKVLR